MPTANIYDFADTWNGAGDFDLIKGVVTNTLSGSGSNLLNLSIAGGASIVGSKGGVLTLNDGSNSLAISPVVATTRTNLGLGTIATQAASAVAITGGTISGLTSLAMAASANANPISLTGYSLTGTNAQSLLDLSGTWNTSGTPTAIKLNVTDTASNASSLLMDLQVGGTSQINVSKAGIITSGATASGWVMRWGTLSENIGIRYSGSGNYQTQLYANNSMRFGWDHSGAYFGGYFAMSSDYDVYLVRDAAATLALRNSTTGQTFRTYNTYTNSTNYERHRLEWSSNVLYSGAEALGTGTARLEVHTGAAVKALTGGTETAFVRISCADDSSLGGVIHYAIYAKDAGNDMQLRTGSVNFAIVNKTGGAGLTCGLGTVINEAVTTSSGTLTVTFDADVSGADVADIRANAVSSLTETTLDIRYRVEIFGPSTTVTPL